MEVNISIYLSIITYIYHSIMLSIYLHINLSFYLSMYLIFIVWWLMVRMVVVVFAERWRPQDEVFRTDAPQPVHAVAVLIRQTVLVVLVVQILVLL